MMQDVDEIEKMMKIEKKWYLGIIEGSIES